MEKEELWELAREYIKESASVSNKVCNFFFTDTDKYVVGTGRQAAVVLEICRNFRTKINNLISESSIIGNKNNSYLLERKGYWKECTDSVPVITIDSVPPSKEIQFILTVGSANYAEYERILLTKGFKSDKLFRCDWDHNTDLRKICYTLYKIEYDRWRLA